MKRRVYDYDEVLEFILMFQHKHGRSPRNREIARACGVPLSAVESILEGLELDGRIQVEEVRRINVRPLDARSPQRNGAAA